MNAPIKDTLNAIVYENRVSVEGVRSSRFGRVKGLWFGEVGFKGHHKGRPQNFANPSPRADVLFG